MALGGLKMACLLVNIKSCSNNKSHCIKHVLHCQCMLRRWRLDGQWKLLQYFRLPCQ